MNLFRYLYSLLYMHTIYISITLISELHDFFYKVQFKKIKKLPKVGVGENSRIQRTIGGIMNVSDVIVLIPPTFKQIMDPSTAL